MTPLLVVTLALLAQTDPDDPAPIPVEAPPAEAPAPEAPAEVPAAEAPAPEAAPVGEPPPVVDPVAVPPAPAPDVPSEADCLALVKEHKSTEARDCYARRTALDGEDGARARALADLVSNLRLEAPGELEARSPPSPSNFTPGLDPGALLTSGKAELVLSSTLAGGYLAVLGAASVLQLGSGGVGGPLAAGLLFLAPVAGGGVGLVTSGLAVIVWPGMTAGDANVMRAFLMLGAWDSYLLPMQLIVSGQSTSSSMIPLGMGAIVVASAAAGVGTALLTDLPEGAGSMALSGGLWTTVVVSLGALSMNAFKTDTSGITPMIIWSSNLGFAGGLLASQLVPMSRAETWALDVGGGVGLLGGAAIAVYGRAPNPFLGWGTMALGTVLGMGAGYATAHFVPQWLADGTPPVAVSPFVAPDPGDVTGRTVVMGAILQGGL